jgi:hypothetical protein
MESDSQQRLPCPIHIVSILDGYPFSPSFDMTPSCLVALLSLAVKKTERRLFIGNMNVLLTIGGESDHNAFLELFLARFEKQAANIRTSCNFRRQLDSAEDQDDIAGSLRGKASYALNATISELNATSVMTNQEAEERRLYRAWNGDFHPYVWHVLTGSQYYFRYRGSWVEPPCLEDLTVEWRVMKEPIKISRAQFDRLDKIFYQRLNPTTCVRESAGRPRAGSTYKKDYNRPIQTTTEMHDLTYCECVDFSSGYPKDKTYCAKSMADRGVFRFQG